MYRYISRESCSQFDSLPLTYFRQRSWTAPRALVASTAVAVTPSRASASVDASVITSVSVSGGGAIPGPVSTSAFVCAGASLPPRPPATCPPASAHSCGDDERATQSKEALNQAAAVLSPGVIARFANPRRYAGVAGRQRYKAGEARAHAIDA